MSEFKPFAIAVDAQLKKMSKTGLFTTATDKDALWDLYLASFPEGTNNLYRERTEHDCTCCKQFIRNIGGVVTINEDLSISTVWDNVNLGNEYDVVAKALSAYVKQHAITDIYLNDTNKVGLAANHESGADGKIRTYNHFHTTLEGKFVLLSDAIASRKGEIRQTIEVFGRGLETITAEAAEIVLDLIDQNSLYRGSEHRAVVQAFATYKAAFDTVKAEDRAAWLWRTGTTTPGGKPHPIRNTSIGTLLVDLSEGRELADAVKSFEAMVAPQNYKRPTALFTTKMIENAQKRVVELGLQDSLARRYAVYDDLTINNVLFADLAAQKAMDPFAQLAAEVKVSTKTLDKVEEISISDFLSKVVPQAHAMEVMVENGHIPNLMSLIAPVTAGAANLFQWDNNFCWSYNGEVADSIKERVKAAGGNVEGILRVSLAWFNDDDLDLHLFTPRGSHVSYSKRSADGAVLDIDMNGLGGMSKTRTPVENIYIQNKRDFVDGVYRFSVNNFALREKRDVGFTLEVEYNGVVKRFSHNGLNHKATVEDALVITVKGGEIVSMVSELKADDASQEVWGVKTQTFHKVQLLLESPNFWDGQTKGNKHVFFILDGCTQPGQTRGFYNEYLRPELSQDRKVFEMLGSKMRVAESDNQLSGLGFSSTQRNHVFVKVSGSFNRTLKVIF